MMPLMPMSVSTPEHHAEHGDAVEELAIPELAEGDEDDDAAHALSSPTALRRLARLRASGIGSELVGRAHGGGHARALGELVLALDDDEVALGEAALDLDAQQIADAHRHRPPVGAAARRPSTRSRPPRPRSARAARRPPRAR